MISVNALRQGVVFKDGGRFYQVLTFRRHKMARGKGVIKVEVRDLESGSVRELTFKSGATVEEVEAHCFALEFVYHDERRHQVVLSNPETKERFRVEDSRFLNEEAINYLSGGTQVTVTEVGGEILSVEIPSVVRLRVKTAPPGEKGDTAGSASKVVELETGLKVSVPLFVQSGDLIEINTKSGKYKGRV